MKSEMKRKYVKWFEHLSSADVASVGGKNASLGEMIATLKDQGIRVPDGFAATADAYRLFLEHNDLDEQINDLLRDFSEGKNTLEKTGKSIRQLFYKAEFPDELSQSIRDNYKSLSQNYNVDEADVAVRSSATAEDLPEASFAGQQESYLNITGEDDVLEACKNCFASLFTNRAISYRNERGFDHMKVALSLEFKRWFVRTRQDQASCSLSIPKPDSPKLL